uniref:Uncharacterized protein n=1 Tax=Rhizobium meliloti TaxID=382 RepID=I2E1K4_RHIML|nr:short hypothetical protein [Sinorhizobium meliloti]
MTASFFTRMNQISLSAGYADRLVQICNRSRRMAEETKLER